MRSILFVSTLLATALIGSSALAERTGDETSTPRNVTNVRELKERIQHDSAEKHATPSEKQRVEKAPAAVERFRPQGDMYDRTGHKVAGGLVTPQSSQTAATSKMPAKLLPGRSHGEVLEPVSRKSSPSNAVQTTVGSTQMTWSAGGKSVRSFVHFTNDKGQTNNNIHGATATAAKMRLCAKIIMGTAGAGAFHVFSWQTAGGDSQSLFPGN